MVTATPWIRNLRLGAADAVFDGQEACCLRQMLGVDTLQDGHAPRPSSLTEQALLAARLDHAGRLEDGLRRTASFGLESFGVAGRAVLHASSLADLEKSLRSFAPLLNLRHDVTLRRMDDGWRLLLRPLVPVGGNGAEYLQLLDGVKLERFLDDLLQRQGSAGRRVDRDREAPSGSIRVPAELQAGFPRTNLTEYRRYAKAAQRKMRSLEHQHLATTVRRILVAGSGRSERLPDLADVARQLGYSQRTFRRRLTERGTSFMDCVNDVRHQLALRYLATTTFTVEAIAERLGYSDTANFRHAFRRWTGVSPSAYVARASADLPVTVMRTFREEAA